PAVQLEYPVFDEICVAAADETDSRRSVQERSRPAARYAAYSLSCLARYSSSAMTLSRFLAICRLRESRTAACRRSSVLSAKVGGRRSGAPPPPAGQCGVSPVRTSASNSAEQVRQWKS